MDEKHFIAPAGVLMGVGRGAAAYRAFVPAPLPPVIDWTGLVGPLSSATLSLGQLAGTGHTLPNPHLLLRPFLRREAVASSRIEGTQASLTDLVLFEASPQTAQVPDVQEVANYVRALEHGLARSADLPMSLRLIREIHGVLLSGVRGHERTPGEFRTSQNWIGPQGSTLNTARFVPPPPDRLMEVLGQLETFIHSSSELPPLVRLAAIHYQFEAIHPFLDGNGRVGRLLVTLLLCLDGILGQPLLYLSAYFERNRQEYYDTLLDVSRASRWEAWFLFFLRGVQEQSRDAVRCARRLLDLRVELHVRLHKAQRSALVLKLVDDLFDRPATTVPDAARLLGVTHRAAQGNVDKLVAAGILVHQPGTGHPRVYVAVPILQALDETPS